MKYRLSQIRNKDGLYSIRSDTGHRVVMVWDRELGERIVNYLMNSEQAAPELLAACKALIAYRDAAGPLNFQLEKADDFINALHAAIARAEGGE